MRGNAATSGRGAARDGGAGQWWRGGGHLRNFGGRVKVHGLVHGRTVNFHNFIRHGYVISACLGALFRPRWLRQPAGAGVY